MTVANPSILNLFTLFADITQIALGYEHSIILVSNKTSYVFGNNQYGQLGLNDTTARSIPQVSMKNILSISTSAYSSFMIQNNTCYGILPTNPNVCSRNGICSSYDSCACYSNFTGNTCSFPICFGKSSTDSQVCSGFGTCTAPDTCQCNSTFGKNCEFQTYSWKAAVSGSWSDANNWAVKINGTNQAATRSPTNQDIIFIDFPGTYDVTADVNLNITYLSIGAGSSFPTLKSTNKNLVFETLIVNANAALDLQGNTIIFQALTFNGFMDLKGNNAVNFTTDTTMNGRFNYVASDRFAFQKTANIGNSTQITFSQFNFMSTLTLFGSSVLLIDTSSSFSNGITMRESSYFSIPSATFTMKGDLNISSSGAHIGSGMLVSEKSLNLNTPQGSSVSFYLSLNSSGSLTFNGANYFTFGQFISNQFDVNSYLEINSGATLQRNVNGQGSLTFKENAVVLFPSSCSINVPVTSSSKMNFTGSTFNFTKSLTMVNGSQLAIFPSTNLYLLSSFSINSSFIIGGGSLILDSASTSNFNSLSSGVDVRLFVLSPNITFNNGDFSFLRNVTLQSSSKIKLLSSTIKFANIDITGNIDTFTGSSSLINFTSVSNFFGTSNITVPTEIYGVARFSGNFNFKNTLKLNKDSQIDILTGNTLNLEGNSTIIASQGNVIVGSGTLSSSSPMDLYCDSSCNINSILKANARFRVLTGSFYFNNDVSTLSSFDIISKLFITKTASIVSPIIQGNGALEFSSSSTINFKTGSLLSVTLTSYSNVTFDGSSYQITLPSSFVQSTITINFGGVLEVLTKAVVNSTSIYGAGTLLLTSGDIYFVSSTSRIDSNVILKSNTTFNGVFNIYSQFNIQKTLITLETASTKLNSYNTTFVTASNLLGLGEINFSKTNWTGSSIIEPRFYSETLQSFDNGTYTFKGSSQLDKEVFISPTSTLEFLNNASMNTFTLPISGGGLILIQSSSRFSFSGSSSITPFVVCQGGNVSFSNSLTFNSRVNLTNSNIVINNGASITFVDQLNIETPKSLSGPGEIRVLQSGVMNINGNLDISNTFTLFSPVQLKGTLYFKNLVTFLQNSTLTIPQGSTVQFDDRLRYTVQNSMILGQGDMIIGASGNATFSGTIPNINVNFYSNYITLFSNGYFNFTMIFNLNQNSLLTNNLNSVIEISQRSTMNTQTNSIIGTGKFILGKSSSLLMNGGANISYVIESYSNMTLTNGTYRFNGKVTLFDSASMLINSQVDLYNDFVLRTNYQGIVISGSGSFNSYAGTLDFGALAPASFNIIFISYSKSIFTTSTYTFNGFSFFGTTSSFNISSQIDFNGALEVNSTQAIVSGDGILQNYGTMKLNGIATHFLITINCFGNVTITKGIYTFSRNFTLTNTYITVSNPAELFINDKMYITQSFIYGNGKMTLNVNGYIEHNGNFTVDLIYNINSLIRFYPGNYFFTNNATLNPTSKINALPGSYVEFVGNCDFQTNPTHLTGGGVIKFSKTSALVLSGTVSVVNVTFTAFSNVTFASGQFFFLQYTSFGPGTTVTINPNVSIEISNVCDIYNVDFVGGGTIRFSKSSTVTITGSTNTYDTFFDIKGTSSLTGNYYFRKNGSLDDSTMTIAPGSTLEFQDKVSLTNTRFNGAGTISFQSNAVNNWYSGATVNTNLLSSKNMIFGNGTYTFNRNFDTTNTSNYFIPNDASLVFNGATNLQTTDNTLTGTGNITVGTSGTLTLTGGSKVEVTLNSNGNTIFNGYYTLAKRSSFSQTSQTTIPKGSTVEIYNRVDFITNLNSLVGGGDLVLAKNSSLYLSNGSNVTVSIQSYTNLNVLTGQYHFNNPVKFNDDAYLSIQSGSSVQLNEQFVYNTNQGNITGKGLFIIGRNGYANFTTSKGPTTFDVSVNSYNLTNFNTGTFIFEQDSFFGPTSQITIQESLLQINSKWEVFSNQKSLNGNGRIQLNSRGLMFFSGGPTNIDVIFESNSNMTFLAGSYNFKKSTSTQNSLITIQNGSFVTFDSQTSLISTNFVGSGLSTFSSSSVVNWFGGTSVNANILSNAPITFQNGTFVFNGPNTTFTQVSNTILPFNSTIEFRSKAYLFTTPSNLIGNGTFFVAPTGNVEISASSLEFYFNITSNGQLSFMNGNYFIQTYMNMEQSNTFISPSSTLDINTLWEVKNSPTIIGGGKINLTPRGNIKWITSSLTTVNSIISTDSLMTFESGSFSFQNNIDYTNRAETKILPNASVSFDKTITVNAQTNSFNGGGKMIFTSFSDATFSGVDSSFKVDLIFNSKVNYLTGLYKFMNSLTMSSTSNITVSSQSVLEFYSNVDITNNPSSLMGLGLIIIMSPSTVTMRGGLTTITPTINSFSIMSFQSGKYHFTNQIGMNTTSQNIIFRNTTIQFDNLCTVQSLNRNVFSGGGSVIFTNVMNQFSGNYQNIFVRVIGQMNQLGTTQVDFDRSMMVIDGELSYTKLGNFNFINSNFTVTTNGVIRQKSGKITYTNALLDIRDSLSNQNVLAAQDSSIIINSGKIFLTTDFANETVTLLVPILNHAQITVSGTGYYYFTHEYVQTSKSTLSLQNVNMNVTGVLSITNGVLQISGTIQTQSLNVSSNTGIMRMNNPGKLKIIGNCHLFQSTTLVVTIYGLGKDQFDYIQVTGLLNLESFVYIKLGPDYRPVIFDKVRFLDYGNILGKSLVNLIGASYRNGKINRYSDYAEIEVITSIGSVGNLNYSCHDLQSRKIIEFNKFYLSGQISLTLTSPKVEQGKWVGFGFGPNPNFTDSILVVSTGNRTFQMTPSLGYLVEYETILDIGANLINTIFDIGPLYQSMSVFLSILWFEQQNYIFYFEMNSTSFYNGTNSIIPKPDVIEIYKYKVLTDDPIDCTNFLAPSRAEIYSYYSLGFMLGFYVILFILCLIFSTKQPLKSRGVSPYLTIFFLFAQLLLEVRNYFYVTSTQQTLCLFFSFGVYPLMLICFIMTFTYFVRYLAIINVNEKKNDLAKFDKNHKIDKSDRFKRISTFWMIMLKVLGSFWFPVIVLTLSYALILILYLVIQAGYGFICRFDTLVFLKLVNTIIMIIMFAAIIILIISDIIANYKSTIVRCDQINYVIYKDPFYFRVQIFLFFPLLCYCLISELWMFANTFSYKDIVNSFVPSLAMNTVQFSFLLIVDVMFPLLVTFISLIRNWILSRNVEVGSIEEIMKNPETNVMFKRLCEKEFSIENYMAYDDIQNYKSLKSKETAVEIYEKYFLGPESELEVNVTKAERLTVKEKLDRDEITDNLFDTVQSSITTNLADTLSRLIYEKEYIIYKNNKKVKTKMLEDLGI